MLTRVEVEAVFRSLLPATVRVAALAVKDAPKALVLPPELEAARPQRQREFRAGRACADQALRELGITEAVGRDPSTREALWPKGIAGSISHTRILAVAAAGSVPALGIDLEPFLSTEALRDVRADAISDDEWHLLGEDAQLATALFSAKEALFKYRWPTTRVFLEFTDVRLISRDTTTLSLRITATNEVLRIRHALRGDHAFTVASSG